MHLGNNNATFEKFLAKNLHEFGHPDSGPPSPRPRGPSESGGQRRLESLPRVPHLQPQTRHRVGRCWGTGVTQLLALRDEKTRALSLQTACDPSAPKQTIWATGKGGPQTVQAIQE